MIRIYYLKTEKIDNVEYCKGCQYVHDAILDVEGTLRKLFQDTTDTEHTGLIAVASSWREATQKEIAQLQTSLVQYFYVLPLKFIPETGTEVPKRIQVIENFLSKAFPG